MSSIRCPYCDEPIRRSDRDCPSCGEALDDDDAAEPQFGAVTRMVVPLGRPVSAIAAGYCGLLAIFPLLGIPFAIGGIVCGIFAISAIRRDPKLSGLGRAWFGIIVGTLMLLLQGGVAILMALGAIR